MICIIPLQTSIHINCETKIDFFFNFFEQEKTNDTILIKSTENGGTVIFNIYVDNYSLSMYGFSIYDVDFYEFILDDTYCGYNSFSYYTTV